MLTEVSAWRIAPLLAATLAVATSACALVMTPQPGEVFIKGAIVESTGTLISVRTKSGQVVQLQGSDATELVAGERTVSADCLSPGTRVGVFGRRDASEYSVRKIHVFSGRCLRDSR